MQACWKPPWTTVQPCAAFPLRASGRSAWSMAIAAGSALSVWVSMHHLAVTLDEAGISSKSGWSLVDLCSSRPTSMWASLIGSAPCVSGVTQHSEPELGAAAAGNSGPQVRGQGQQVSWSAAVSTAWSVVATLPAPSGPP
ncbi:hypothetical protein HaLaN_13456 [Haematococcus lacustris]|uniref:Uncharacterized protein n=1 Tax=Haematococcus lacustris TaxID=44745 RepID=A0A699ZDH3_HAELA|nr:hypothetical protein HaLaN_13456 [Haematococcus lacustris]